MNKQRTPKDFDENPVWTKDMHAKARPASDMLGKEAAAALVRKPGRPVGTTKPNAKQSITLRLDPDVIDGWKKTGVGWHGRINDALRDALNNEAA